jgi:hypothetical protein
MSGRSDLLQSATYGSMSKAKTSGLVFDTQA